MKRLLDFVDGYKRIIVLVLVLAQLWALQVFKLDLSVYTHVLFGMLGWDPEQLLPVPAPLLGSTILGVLAIFDGIRKALRERAQPSDKTTYTRI